MLINLAALIVIAEAVFGAGHNIHRVKRAWAGSKITARAGEPANIAKGSLTIAQGCTQYYNVKKGEYCYIVAEKFGLSLEDFYGYNGQIDDKCSNLYADQAYCVSQKKFTVSTIKVAAAPTDTVDTKETAATNTGAAADDETTTTTTTTTVAPVTDEPTTTTTTTTTTSRTTTTTTTKSEPKPTTPSSGSGSIYSANCGGNQADGNSPNGQIWWLNCGISRSNVKSKWTPPEGVTIDKLKTVSLSEALANDSVWKPCEKYFSIFNQMGAKYGVPPIFLASFAIQESTCRADVRGGGGEMGLMQITRDKCGGRSDSACLDPWFNIETGAAYFKKMLSENGGNVPLAIGRYNGWYPGLTYEKATAARYTSCCKCQNNLDYLDNFLNGWVVGKQAYRRKTYNNLAVC